MTKLAAFLGVVLLASGSCEECGRQVDEAISGAKTAVVEIQTEIAQTPASDLDALPAGAIDRVREVEGQVELFGFFALADFSSGTAFYVEDDRLVTAHHVTQGRDILLLERFGGSDLFRVEVSKGVKEQDLAILRPVENEKENQPPVMELRTDPLEIGAAAWALCASPAEQSRYVRLSLKAVGYSNVYGNGTYTVEDGLVFDGEAHGGCSGGPVIDASGKVIGMTLAAGNGMTFASSSKSIADRLQ